MRSFLYHFAVFIKVKRLLDTLGQVSHMIVSLVTQSSESVEIRPSSPLKVSFINPFLNQMTFMKRLNPNRKNLKYSPGETLGKGKQNMISLEPQICLPRSD